MLEYLFLVPSKWKKSEIIYQKLPKPPFSNKFKIGIVYKDEIRQAVLRKYPKLLHKPKLQHFTIKGQAIRIYKESMNEDDFHYRNRYMAEYTSLVAHKIIRGIKIGYGDRTEADKIVGACKSLRIVKRAETNIVWSQKIIPKQSKICIWHAGKSIRIARAILQEDGYTVDVCANNHRAYSESMAWVNNQRNKGKKMAVIVKKSNTKFSYQRAPAGWQYIYYNGK